jgi:DNA-binding NarL/FixJ family response regulator
MLGDSDPALTSLQALSLRLRSADPVPRADERPRVVVVDDDPGVRQSLASALGLHFLVMSCASGEEASHTVDSETAAVILDIRMPHRDGFAIYEAIRSDLPHLPIIFYSGYQDVKDPYEVMNAYRPFAYISKESPLSTLQTAVKAAVVHHHEVMRCSNTSRKIQVRLLKELLALLRCDHAAFQSVDGEQLRAESIVLSQTLVEQGPSKIQVPSCKYPKVDSAFLFDGTHVRPWPSGGKDLVPVSPGAYALIPVANGQQLLGVISAAWQKDTANIKSQAFRSAQELAEHFGFTAAGTALHIKGLESQIKRGNVRHRRLRAELRSLQARVNPHFLYNSLNSIAALVHRDPDAAEQMVLELGEVFRYVLHHSESDLIPLSEELHVVRSYLKIEQKRLASRLRVTINVADNTLGCRVPPLLLLPLVENAVLHGAAAHEAGATITISATTDGKLLYLSVGDTGPGVENPMHQGHGRSVRNLKRRLRLHYGDAMRFRRMHPPSGGYRVALVIPMFLESQ